MIQKDTKGKPRLSLLPRLGLLGAVRAREYGIEKYKEDGGWQGVEPQDFIDAAIRHLLKYSDGLRGYAGGHPNDEESGLSHMDHATASVILASAVLESRKIQKEVNDRQYAESDKAGSRAFKTLFENKSAEWIKESEELGAWLKRKYEEDMNYHYDWDDILESWDKVGAQGVRTKEEDTAGMATVCESYDDDFEVNHEEWKVI